MEVPYEDFVLGEAKNHRIQYIRTKDGEVKWDRKERIDTFSQDKEENWTTFIKIFCLLYNSAYLYSFKLIIKFNKIQFYLIYSING